MTSFVDGLATAGRITIAGAPEGFDAGVLRDIADSRATPMLYVARDDVRLARMADHLAFFAPDLPCFELPAWDCLPYDRISPNADILSRRLRTLTRLAGRDDTTRQPAVVLTTVAAVLQKLPPRAVLAGLGRVLHRGERQQPEDLGRWLETLGYGRVETVTEPGDYALRGGILDVFTPGEALPLRLDFFGDEIETIRPFDPATQLSRGKRDEATLVPMSELILDEDSVSRFRTRYRSLFGSGGADDPLYAAVSEQRRHVGMEHWLPLFHETLETVFDFLPEAVTVLDHQVGEAVKARIDLIAEYYAARRNPDLASFRNTAAPYRAVPPEALYFDEAAWQAALQDRTAVQLTPFAQPSDGVAVFDAGGRPGVDFAEQRQRPDVNIFDALTDRIRGHRRNGRRVLLTALTTGSRARLADLLKEHGFEQACPVAGWAEAEALPPDQVGLAVLELERGFTTPDQAVITEPDVLGDRLIRRRRAAVKPENLLREASSLTPGDLVVHVDHGIGQYDGLETISVGDAPHDCLRLVYAQEDKLYLPVENIDMVSRYGGDSDAVALDRLGSANWQARKAKLKQRIREMADELIQLAAARVTRPAPVLQPAGGAFDEFCARFPYTETEDQARAIDDVLADLSAGMPADRLICGDVGFGKTEVALRAAFVTALEGRQVAVVVPTTLLCRQHARTFQQRFTGFPVCIEEISRLIAPRQVKATKAGLTDGTVDIVVGTHALLARDVRFRDLGLLIIDEEQHFGVAHKEKLKKLKADVHVLTLTATPIPRTLQMALVGVRTMSLIATPPVDRLAVRTFVLPFDPVVIREAILREHFRGGQTFYVCPRIEDLDEVEETLKALVPEVTVVRAHGRMSAKDLEAAVGAFYEGAFNVLLSTNIIESGLDLPSVNTIVLHRADMFGLAQLYQLRGRVGRGKTRAFAYLTLPPDRKLTPTAEKRLAVMQSLDALGAGFTLASHDMDIRGAGNLLGDEQSGHIREVGIELYQQMLEEAVAEARGDGVGGAGEEHWSPQISLGLSVLIPEDYVPDLGLRLGLYRRLADLTDAEAIDGFAAELADRFGPLPDAAKNLLAVVELKAICHKAGIERLEAGPKGAVVAFRNNTFTNPSGLVQYITRQVGTAKLRPDHRLVFKRSWETPGDRLKGAKRLADDLAAIAAG